jgi:hypothetical protein
MLAEIREAFSGVTREGGCSWSQAYANDMNEPNPAVDDPDRDWLEVARDPRWRMDPGLGGFSFLDPIGFRYYLAAAMWRLVNEPDSGDISYHLQRSQHDRGREKRWSLFEPRQVRTVARFVAYMHRSQPPITEAPELNDLNSTSEAYSCFFPYGHALQMYWQRCLDEPCTPPD